MCPNGRLNITPAVVAFKGIVPPKNLNSFIIYSALCRWRGGWSVWVSGVNSVAAKVTLSSDIIEKQKKTTTCLHTAHVVSSECLWEHERASEEDIRGKGVNDALLTLGWHHTRSMEACYVYFLLFLMSGEEVPFNSIVLDLAATLFIPETPKVICGLRHFTHRSISRVVSR